MFVLDFTLANKPQSCMAHTHKSIFLVILKNTKYSHVGVGLYTCQQTPERQFGQEVCFLVQCKSHKTLPTAYFWQARTFAVVFVLNYSGL